MVNQFTKIFENAKKHEITRLNTFYKNGLFNQNIKCTDLKKFYALIIDDPQEFNKHHQHINTYYNTPNSINCVIGSIANVAKCSDATKIYGEKKCTDINKAYTNLKDQLIQMLKNQNDADVLPQNTEQNNIDEQTNISDNNNESNESNESNDSDDYQGSDLPTSEDENIQNEIHNNEKKQEVQHVNQQEENHTTTNTDRHTIDHDTRFQKRHIVLTSHDFFQDMQTVIEQIELYDDAHSKLICNILKKQIKNIIMIEE